MNQLASIWRPSGPSNPFPRPVRSVTMPPAAKVVPRVTADTFRALSPADRLAAVTTRDSFPCSRAAWRPLARELLLTLHHHPSSVVCAECPADDAFLGSVCLMWAGATDALAHLEMESLRHHAG